MKLAFVCPYPRFTCIGGNVFGNDPSQHTVRLCRYDNMSAEDFVLGTLEYRVPLDYCMVELDNPKANFSFTVLPKKDYDPTVDYAKDNIDSDKRFYHTLTLPTRCPYGGVGSVTIDLVVNNVVDFGHSFVGLFDSIVDIVPNESDTGSSDVESSKNESGAQYDVDKTIKPDDGGDSDDKTEDKNPLKKVSHHPVAYGDSDSVLIRLDANRVINVEKRESKAPLAAVEIEMPKVGQEFSKPHIDLESQFEGDKLATHLQAIQNVNGRSDILTTVLDKLITGEKITCAEIGRDAQSPKLSAPMASAGDKFFPNETEPVFIVGRPESGKAAALLEMSPLLDDSVVLELDQSTEYDAIDAPTLLKRIQEAFEHQIKLYTVAYQHNITTNAIVKTWSDFTMASVLMLAQADQPFDPSISGVQNYSVVSPRQQWLKQNVIDSDLVQFLNTACKMSDQLAGVVVEVPTDKDAPAQNVGIVELAPGKIPAVVQESLRKLVHFYRTTLE